MHAHPHGAAPTDPREVATQLRAREPLFHAEPRDADRTHFEGMTASDLRHVGASGTVQGREAAVARTWERYRTGQHGDDAAWIVEDFAVRHLDGDTWLASYRLHQGERVSERTTAWTWSRDGWQVRFHQGTQVGS